MTFSSVDTTSSKKTKIYLYWTQIVSPSQIRQPQPYSGDDTQQQDDSLLPSSNGGFENGTMVVSENINTHEVKEVPPGKDMTPSNASPENILSSPTIESEYIAATESFVNATDINGSSNDEDPAISTGSGETSTPIDAPGSHTVSNGAEEHKLSLLSADADFSEAKETEIPEAGMGGASFLEEIASFGNALSHPNNSETVGVNFLDIYMNGNIYHLFFLQSRD